MKKVFSKYLKIILVFVMFVAIGITSTIKVSAYNENDRINALIEQNVKDGYLPSFHLKYMNYPYYHTLYVKHGTSLGGYTEEHLLKMLRYYSSDEAMWSEIIKNMDIPLTAIEPNTTIGIFFDGDFIYVLWSSEYIPHEEFTMRSITFYANGKTTVVNNEKMSSPCSHLNGDPSFELTFQQYYPDMNLQLNVTPILRYHHCDKDGKDYIGGASVLDGVKDFSVVGWTAGLNNLYGEVDETYTFSSTSEAVFNFAEPFKAGGKPVGQFQSYKYIEITDCIAQSSYDAVFGGYKHYVFFNTPIDFDQLYRVDVSYTLLADDAIWTKKLFDDPKTRKVTKSLSAEKNRGGLFNLKSYQGLTVGNFASNEKDNHSYQYRLMLNYNEDNWDVDEWFHIMEADYKRVDEFHILRMNFIYQGEEFEMPVKMDTVSGTTKKIYERDQILDTNSTIWKFKETAYDTADKVVDTTKDAFTGSKKVLKGLLIAGGCTLGAIGLYFAIKGVLTIRNLLNNGNKEE